jgi:hypothetical protein
MPSATGQFGASNIVALFQGFVNGAGALVTRAAQSCQVVRLSAGQYQLQLNNVVPDDANFMAQVHQFSYTAGQAAYAVVCAFPPVGQESVLGSISTYNYINFGFYSTLGTPTDPNAYGLFNISVFNCNDSIHQSPGNP